MSQYSYIDRNTSFGQIFLEITLGVGGVWLIRNKYCLNKIKGVSFKIQHKLYPAGEKILLIKKKKKQDLRLILNTPELFVV